MMTLSHEFGDLVVANASLLPQRPWRFLLAHDASAKTCRPLMQAVERALGNVDIVGAASVESALAELRGSTFDACFVCLDLPPVPSGGARLAQKMVRDGRPVVLVTRSLRWLPADAAKLREVPWVPPNARPSEVEKAVRAALAEAARPTSLI
jgi:DNA-binding NarL/FixJ family response regulator